MRLPPFSAISSYRSRIAVYCVSTDVCRKDCCWVIWSSPYYRSSHYIFLPSPQRPSKLASARRCSVESVLFIPTLTHILDFGFQQSRRLKLTSYLPRNAALECAGLMYRNFKVEANCVALQATLVSVVPMGLYLGGTLYPPINWWASACLH